VARWAGGLISEFHHSLPHGERAPQAPVADSLSAPTVEATVEALDAAGCGIAESEGRPVAVEGALVGERILFRPGRGRRRGARARLVQVLQAAPARTEPVCRYFQRCGGCRLQHMAGDAQLSWKQQLLRRAFIEHGRLEPEAFLEPLTGPTTGYRRRARLGVKYVPGKGGALVGFREKTGAKLAEIDGCLTLEPRVGGAIGELRRVIDALDGRRRIPQLEVAMGDAGTALVLRHLDPLSAHDQEVLRAFGRARDWQLHLQPGGPDSVRALWPEDPPPLAYALPDFQVELEFLPLDFIQVNAAMNRLLVRAAVAHLDLRASSRVLDLFCGIGNFTLAAARSAAQVAGVEGDAALVARARGNARRNRIDNVSFAGADLSCVDDASPWWNEPWDRLLLDPPRSGAAHVLGALREPLPERIVYVSCNPESLASDAGLLVHRKGYRLSSAAVVDMFPHTGHCEAMAVFTRR
jgi:23S rRNA (uracil1939-C5)-methyltransferase